MLIASSALTQQRNNNLYRKRPCTRPLEKNLIEMDGKFYLNFSSNDYLGLSQDAQVIDALCQAAQTSGVGSTASRMICGHHPAHEALEKAFAEWMGYETAILFSNGYMANLGVFEALSHLNASNFAILL
jgi:8-amino-7-oxononanoate synthase